MLATLLSKFTFVPTKLHIFNSHLQLCKLNLHLCHCPLASRLYLKVASKPAKLHGTMLSSENSKNLLYVCAGLSTFAAYKHTSLAFSELFPKIDRGFGSSELLTAFSTKSNFLQVGASWALIGMLIFSPQLENKVRFGKLPKLLHKGFIIGRWHMAEASNGNSPAQVGQVWLEYWL